MRLCLFLFVLLIGCYEKEEQKKVVHESEGFYEEGTFIKDSVFHGIVHRYSLDDRYLGYTNYWYGIINGIYISKYANGITQDSIFFKYGLKDGVSFNFDTTGRLVYKANYLHDRPVGSIYSYDTRGEIKEYYFQDFEGKTLYSIKYDNDDTLEFGGLSNYRYDTVTINDRNEKIHLFTYLVYIPDL